MEERKCIVKKSEREKLLKLAEKFVAVRFNAERKLPWSRIPLTPMWSSAFVRRIHSKPNCERYAAQDHLRVVVDLENRTVFVMVGIGCWKL